MTREQIESRINTVQKMIASYSLTMADHEKELAYAKRKRAEYDHELDVLYDKRRNAA